MESIKDKVAIIGMGCTHFGELYDEDITSLIVDAAYEAYDDAGIDPKEIQAAWLGTSSGAMGLLLSTTLKLHNVPVTRVENACSTGLEAMRNAAMAIASGVYDVVLALGAEKQHDMGFRGSASVGLGYRHPVIGLGTSFPGDFAMAATRYMERWGLSFEHFKKVLAKIDVTNHHNGTMSPKAHMRREITEEQAINAPMIAWPLGLFDCCGNSDGSACAILCRADLAKKYKPKGDYVLIKGLGLSTGTGWGAIDTDYDFVHWEENIEASRQAYEMAGIKNPRKELDLAIVHDCFAITQLILMEDLGFSPRGKGWEDVEAGTFTLEGELPINTDGGLKCFGHPTGASGLRMNYEVYNQLLGRAGPRQLKNPKLGLAHNFGGSPAGGGAAGVTILGTKE